MSATIFIDPEVKRKLDISIALSKLYYQPVGYQRTVQKLYKASQDAGNDFSPEDVHEWLERQAIHQIYKPYPRYIPQVSFNKITKPNSVHQADVLYMPYDKVRRVTYLFCLNVVDVASRYKASIPIGATSVKNRQEILTSGTIAKAFKEIYEDPNSPLIWPKVLQVDRGPEFKGRVVEIMAEHGVRIRVATTKTQQSIVERYNRTLAERLFKIEGAVEMVTDTENTEWVKNLHVVVDDLNNSVTRLLGISPSEAMQKDEVFASPSKIPKNRVVGEDEICLPAGSLVRYLIPLSEYRSGKRRATDPTWSKKIFEIESATVINGQPVMYKLIPIDGDPYLRTKIFVREELLSIAPDTMLPPTRIKN